MKGRIIVSASAELIESVLKTGYVMNQCATIDGIPDDAELVEAVTSLYGNMRVVELTFETATIPEGEIKHHSPAYQRPPIEDCALCGGFHRRACEGGQ